jgi:hypothetical protein
MAARPSRTNSASSLVSALGDDRRLRSASDQTEVSMMMFMDDVHG